jgi:hypothetical protein
MPRTLKIYRSTLGVYLRALWGCFRLLLENMSFEFCSSFGWICLGLRSGEPLLQRRVWFGVGAKRGISSTGRGDFVAPSPLRSAVGPTMGNGCPVGSRRGTKVTFFARLYADAELLMLSYWSSVLKVYRMGSGLFLCVSFCAMGRLDQNWLEKLQDHVLSYK